MIIVIICACIVGGMWWYNLNQIKKAREDITDLRWGKMSDETFDSFAGEVNKEIETQFNAMKDLNERITLLAKDMLEMQTTVSKLKPRSKKHANTKVNRTK